MGTLFALLVVFLGPAKNDHLCFVSDTFQPECGTYGYAKTKKLAQKAAFELCEGHCGGPCQLDYCERR